MKELDFSQVQLTDFEANRLRRLEETTKLYSAIQAIDQPLFAGMSHLDLEKGVRRIWIRMARDLLDVGKGKLAAYVVDKNFYGSRTL